jgi:dCMP deaminase
MKEKFKRAYMETAQTFSKLSYARRLQVGAVIVKNDSIISYGFNGTPEGWDNNCEDREYMSVDAGGWFSPDEIDLMWPYEDEEGRYKLVTKPEVLHAESNAISKLAKSSNSGEDADLFITHSPCLDCAKLIYQSGIKRVYYRENYRNDQGIQFLMRSGVKVSQISDD